MRRLTRDRIEAKLRQASDRGELFQARWLRPNRKTAVVYVVLARPGGFLILVPGGFVTPAELEEARQQDYPDLLGPSIEVSVTLFGEGGAALGSVGALLLDVKDAIDAELALYEEPVAGIMSLEVDGVLGGPSVADVRSAVDELVGDGAERVAGYRARGDEEFRDLDEEPPLPPAAAARPAGFRPLPSGGPPLRVGQAHELQNQVAELKRQVHELQAALAVPPPPDLADADADMDGMGVVGAARDPQFFVEGRRLGLSDDALHRLRAAAGSPPARLRDPSATRLAAPAAAPAAASASPPRRSVPVPSAPLTQPAVPAATSDLPTVDPPAAPTDVTQLLLRQNEMLIKLLSKQAGGSSDVPNVTSLLGGTAGGLLDDTKVSGARGYAARVALIDQMRARPAAVSSCVRKNLAKALDRPLAKLDPGDMRQYLTREVPFGNYSCLTYFSYILAKLWEEVELLREAAAPSEAASLEVARRIDELHMTVSLGLVFAEQVAVEGGARYQLGRLLMGLEEPPFGTTTQNRPRPGSAPHGRLVEPQWVAAQLAYPKDLDTMAERLRKQQASGSQSGHVGEGGSGKDKPGGK